jgi:hypothetical protein
MNCGLADAAFGLSCKYGTQSSLRIAETRREMQIVCFIGEPLCEPLRFLSALLSVEMLFFLYAFAIKGQMFEAGNLV